MQFRHHHHSCMPVVVSTTQKCQYPHSTGIASNNDQRRHRDVLDALHIPNQTHKSKLRTRSASEPLTSDRQVQAEIWRASRPLQPSGADPAADRCSACFADAAPASLRHSRERQCNFFVMFVILECGCGCTASACLCSGASRYEVAIARAWLLKM